MAEELLADMGKYVVGHNPETLVSRGLGSCIGCAIWDKNKHIGGLAHIMLPDSKDCPGCTEGSNMNKFADLAITNMIKDMEAMGANQKDMIAKIAGGAHMFSSILKDETFNIGQRNFEAAKNKLSERGIQVVSSDIGGGVGRTLFFDIITGSMTVRTKDYTKII